MDVYSPLIILVRPQLAENIGMVARAMGNFDLTQLRLVAPRDGWPLQAAWPVAAAASSILDHAAVFATLEDALADCHYAFATTARVREQAKPVFLPEAAVKEGTARGNAGQRLAFVFGPERTGLENDEISLCDSVITFPVSQKVPSLNLSQAVLLLAYEWQKKAQNAGQGGAVAFSAAPFSMVENSPPASRELLFSFFNYIEAELDRVKFFWPLHRRPIMLRNFRNIFHKMNASEQDIRTLWGAMAELIRGGNPKRFVEKSEKPQNAESVNVGAMAAAGAAGVAATAIGLTKAENSSMMAINIAFGDSDAAHLHKIAATTPIVDEPVQGPSTFGNENGGGF